MASVILRNQCFTEENEQFLIEFYDFLSAFPFINPFNMLCVYNDFIVVSLFVTESAESRSSTNRSDHPMFAPISRLLILLFSLL